MSGYVESPELCDGRCDICPEFAGCGNGNVIIICWGDCKVCKNRKECKNRESAEKDGYTER
jgi:hypothetical protein